MADPLEQAAREFLRSHFSWDDTCFLDDEDFIYGHSVRELMAAFARSLAVRRELEKEIKREIAASIRESLPRRNSVGEFSRFADQLERESQ